MKKLSKHTSADSQHKKKLLFLQAEGTVTHGAEGVHMVTMVVIAVFIVIHAEAVFAVSAAVLESV